KMNKRDMQRLRSTPALDKEEEKDLARRANGGDQLAVERLVTSHLGFVVNVAKGYRRSGIPMSDLFQEGIVGLMQAVKRFNPELDTRLSTYAKWWIRASIQDHVIRSWSLVRLSTTSAQKSLFFNLRRKTHELIEGADSLGDNIVTQLAERFGTTASDVQSLARRVSHRDQSLNWSNDERNGPGWLEQLKSNQPNPEESLTDKSEILVLRSLIVRAIHKLPDRERFIIKNRYFAEVKRTFTAIGLDLNLSKDRVRQLEARALRTLRETLKPGLVEAQIIAD
ncbi:MAG: RNA polymerase factor sigma-32, partial [Pseudomonadota bacterium]|nr:RNA polymerase factor sigma-32 [Pseudomonadota bacterium]